MLVFTSKLKSDFYQREHHEAGVRDDKSDEIRRQLDVLYKGIEMKRILKNTPLSSLVIILSCTYLTL